MTDKVDQKTRSKIMSAVRSKGNKSTERRLRAHLAQQGVRGWRINDRSLPGNPDFVFHDIQLAVFVDGCFWHYCPKCCRLPQSNTEYWHNKIFNNRQRDKENSRKLRAAGWRVVRVWEHALKHNPGRVAARVKRMVELSRSQSGIKGD